MITVNGALRISSSLAGAVEAGMLARQFDGRPPLREMLLLPASASPRPRNISTGIARGSSLTHPVGGHCPKPRRAESVKMILE
jgi:hypothetical protein